MSRVFITGSADGLGLMAARLLIADGHEVFLHARSRARGGEALLGAPGAAGVLVGDLSSIRETRQLADSVNAEGRFDAVIHNAGVGYREPRTGTEDGLEPAFVIRHRCPRCGWPWARRRPTSLAATSTTANLGVRPRSLRTVSFISCCSRL